MQTQQQLEGSFNCAPEAIGINSAFAEVVRARKTTITRINSEVFIFICVLVFFWYEQG